MRELLGLLLFWMTTFFIKHFLEEKTKVDKKFSFPMTFTIIGLLEFLFGLLHVMRIGTFLLIGLSFLYGVWEIKEGNIKIQKEKFKDSTSIMIFLFFVGITILGYFLHLTHYDNFSHWGLIAKTMLETNQLPNAATDYILFKSYQPGSACFLYFLGLLCGKKEGFMIIAQNYLIFSYLSVFFYAIPKEKKWFGYGIVSAFSIFLVTASTISFNNLLVDSLLSVMMICILLVFHENRKDIKKGVFMALPMMIYLFVVKNTGLLLDGILCLFLLFLGIKEGKKKEVIRYVLMIIGILLLVMILWSVHVRLAYGRGALSSKHSLSPQNFYLSLKALGVQNFLQFVKLYWFHLWEWKNNIPNQYMFFLNISMLVYAFFQKEKKVFHWILGMNLVYLGYYIILGGMYILSMPWEEAKVFAGFTRYMMTIINVLIGVNILKLFQRKNKIIFYVLGIILLLVPIYFHFGEFQVLLGKDGYHGSSIEKLDNMLEEIPKDQEYYYFYAPSAKDDFGYLKHLGIYKLSKKHVYVISEKEKIKNIEDNSYLIVFDEDRIEEEVSVLEKISEKVYQKK